MSTEFFVCKKCGNVIVKLHDSGITPNCCGEPMQKLVPNTTDGVGEKHLPQVTTLDRHCLRIQIGSPMHPMLPEHYIHFVVVETKDSLIVHYLHPSDTPIVTISIYDTACVIAVYEYCNLHGLWKTIMPYQEKDCKPHFPSLSCKK